MQIGTKMPDVETVNSLGLISGLLGAKSSLSFFQLLHGW